MEDFSSFEQMMAELPSSFGIKEVVGRDGTAAYQVNVVSITKMQKRTYTLRTAMQAYFVLLRYSYKKWMHLVRAPPQQTVKARAPASDAPPSVSASASSPAASLSAGPGGSEMTGASVAGRAAQAAAAAAAAQSVPSRPQ